MGASCRSGAARRAFSAAGGVPMLIRLILTYARPYTRAILAVLALQLATTLAALYLPTLNAEIIDKGVAVGDTAFILHTGGWMLLFSFLQIGATVWAVYYSARTSMGLGRDLRAAIFHRVGTFSSREVAQF